jgi:hypothetical protein
MGQNSFFNKWISTCKGMSLTPFLIPNIKNNSRWIIDLPARAQTVKL